MKPFTMWAIVNRYNEVSRDLLKQPLVFGYKNQAEGACSPNLKERVEEVTVLSKNEKGP